MTPESLPDLNRITQGLELHLHLPGVPEPPSAESLRLARELPSDEKLEAWLAASLRRAA